MTTIPLSLKNFIAMAFVVLSPVLSATSQTDSLRLSLPLIDKQVGTRFFVSPATDSPDLINSDIFCMSDRHDVFFVWPNAPLISTHMVQLFSIRYFLSDQDVSNLVSYPAFYSGVKSYSVIVVVDLSGPQPACFCFLNLAPEGYSEHARVLTVFSSSARGREFCPTTIALFSVDSHEVTC